MSLTYLGWMLLLLGTASTPMSAVENRPDESVPASADSPSPNTLSTPAPSVLAPPQPLKGLPELSALPVIQPNLFKSQYPGSNDRNTDRFAVDLNQSSLLELQLDQGTPAVAVWRVVGPVKGFVFQGEGQPAVGDLSGLLHHALRGAHSDAEKAFALFSYVRDVVKDWWFPAQPGDLTVEDLNMLIWGFGYGYCYDLSRLLAGLWHQAGLTSRIVATPQHTVAEVFYDGAWHLFDVQHRLAYRKGDGQIASFEELKNQPDLVYQNLDFYGLDPIGYPPPYLANWYKNSQPTYQESLSQPWKIARDFRLNLREGEILDLTYSEPGPAYHADSWVIYYGLNTNQKAPPFPVKGRLHYSPKQNTHGKTMPWTQVTSPRGNPAWMVEMSAPLLFTEGYFEVPGIAALPQAWVQTETQLVDIGILAHGKAHLTKYIAGSNHFKLILELEAGQTPEEASLPNASIELLINTSPIGLPQLRGGLNQIPLRFASGQPHVTVWFQEHAADLSLTGFASEPTQPKPGDDVVLTYTLTNQGSGISQPTSLTVFNNVTAFLSETTQRIGVQTVPPLPPGASTQVSVYWTANTRMTWYGQNPQVQLFDAWLDIEKDTPDFDRANNRQQDVVLLLDEEGCEAVLPGYTPIQ